MAETSTVGSWTDARNSQHSGTAALELAPVSCIGTIGILGNVLVLFVLLSQPSARKRVSNALVINQSIVDCLSSFWLIITYTSLSIPKSYDGRGVWWCWLIDCEGPLWCLATISTTNLMAITVERHLMVVHPVSYHIHVTRKRVTLLIVATWVFTTALMSGFIYPFSGVQDGICVLQGFFPAAWMGWFCSMFYYIVYFFSPIGMFIICYGHSVVVIRRRKRLVLSVHGQSNALSRSQMNLTKVMIAVSVAFIVCWAPINTHYVLMLTEVSPHLNMVDALYRSLAYLSFINSGINPIMYAFNYDDFKKGVAKWIYKAKRGGPKVGVSKAIATTSRSVV